MNGNIHRVQHVRRPAPATCVLRFDRGGLEFRPGQRVLVGLAGRFDRREYTIYSAPGDDYLEILVREIPGGRVSPALCGCEPGDGLDVSGPYGSFTLDGQPPDRQYLFVASGTGISPYHCFVRSYAGLSYRVLHGVRFARELYDREAFSRQRFTGCLSRERGRDYHGRVTGYLREHPTDPNSFCYLCGGCDMVYEVFAILLDQGVPRAHLFTEVYY